LVLKSAYSPECLGQCEANAFKPDLFILARSPEHREAVRLIERGDDVVAPQYDVLPWVSNDVTRGHALSDSASSDFDGHPVERLARSTGRRDRVEQPLSARRQRHSLRRLHVPQDGDIRRNISSNTDDHLRQMSAAAQTGYDFLFDLP